VVTERQTVEPHPASRSRKGRWWLIGGGLLVVLLVAGAAIAIPRIMHAQRVATYTELVTQTNIMLSHTHQLREQTDLATVLYALQLDEAREFQPVLEELSGYSDHYFSPDQLTALAEANSALVTALEDDGLNEVEAATVSFAKDTIETDGYVWQTEFLNLSPDAVVELIDVAAEEQVTPVADDAVTDEVIEQARAAHETAESALAEAEAAFAAAENRALSLVEAVAATLEPLRSSALGAPDQAEVVVAMYPAADGTIVKQMRDAAHTAAGSVSAELFTVDDEYRPVPKVGDATDEVSFEVTDAWRSTIIATHLLDYSKGITGAWISDAGGVEQALGFNPFLPFF
jgi:hypothetical protein